MHLELSAEEARLLKAQLARHIEEMDDELVHTDVHQLQHALNLELEKLRVIDERLEGLIRSSAA